MSYPAITIRGASDDLILVQGAGIDEEFSCWGEWPTYLALSDGTLVSAHYVDGFWRLNVLATGPGSITGKVEATNEDDDYSDMVSVSGPNLKWVVLGLYIARSRQ